MKLILKERFKTLTNGIMLGYVEDDGVKVSVVNVVRAFPGIPVEVTEKQGEKILAAMDCVENVEKPEAGDPVDTMTVKEMNQIFEEKGWDVPAPTVRVDERRAALKAKLAEK